MRRHVTLTLTLILVALLHLPLAASDELVPTEAAAETARPASAQAMTASSSQSLEVVMYGTQECGYCRKARNYFDRRDISYVEHDVGVSVEAFDEFEGLGGYVVPMFVINGIVSHGYDSDEQMDQRLGRGRMAVE